MVGDEHQLLSAAKAGDAVALEQLLDRHQPQIYRFALRMCGHEADARDVLQETLLAAFQHLDQFRGEARLSTWLFQLARSFCVKHRRLPVGAPVRTESLDAPESRGQRDEADGPEVRAQAHELGKLMHRAIVGLGEEAREVLLLRDVEGLSAEEAAEVLGVTVPAVKSRLHRARLGLREALSRLVGDQALGAPCAELANELSAYSAADVDAATCVRIEAHLSTCPHCTAACDDLKRSVSLCRQLPGGEVPEPVRRAVRQALEKAVGG